MTENTLRQPVKPAAIVPTAEDFRTIESLIATGPQSARAKKMAKTFAANTTSAQIAYRLYRAAAEHGHHTIGQIFVERHAEIVGGL